MSRDSSEAISIAGRHRGELRNVIALTIPAVITTSARAFMDVCDFIMVARLPDHNAAAAILPSQVIMWSYIVFGVGIVSMVNTFAAQALGRKSYSECGAYAWQTFYIGIFFGIVGVALIPLIPHVVAFIGHESAVQVQEITYLRIILLTTTTTIISEGLGWFFIGVHRPKVPMWTALEANVVNLTLAYALIFGKFGMPAMGIAGAGWATLTASSYRMVRLGLALVAPSANEAFETRRQWRLSWHRLRNLLRVGVPNGLQITSEVIVWAVFVNVLVGRFFGTVHLLATNTAWQYMRISFMPTIGMGRAVTALVGKSIGEGDASRAIRETRFAVYITLTFMCTLATIYTFCGHKLVYLLEPDEAVAKIGGSIMICAAVFQVFDALAITYTSALRGAGDTFIPSIFFILSQWLIIVGGGWFVASKFPQWGSVGPWSAVATLIAVTGIFLWFRWSTGAWKRIDIFQNKLPEERALQAAELGT